MTESWYLDGSLGCCVSLLGAEVGASEVGISEGFDGTGVEVESGPVIPPSGAEPMLPIDWRRLGGFLGSVLRRVNTRVSEEGREAMTDCLALCLSSKSSR